MTSEDMQQAGIRWIRVTDTLEVAATPVTEAQYRTVMDTCPSSNGDDHPVVNVSWDEAVAFCEQIGARLPTEEEWLAACGEKPAEPIEDHCVFGRQGSVPVASKLPVGGIYDGHGLVWEWTTDVAGPYRVSRGGSWSYTAAGLRVAYRGKFIQGGRSDCLGFRPARSAPPRRCRQRQEDEVSEDAPRAPQGWRWGLGSADLEGDRVVALSLNGRPVWARDVSRGGVLERDHVPDFNDPATCGVAWCCAEGEGADLTYAAQLLLAHGLCSPECMGEVVAQMAAC